MRFLDPYYMQTVVTNCLWWWRGWWRYHSREIPNRAFGFTPAVNLVYSPVKLSSLRQVAWRECCSSLVAYKRRWICRAKVDIV